MTSADARDPKAVRQFKREVPCPSTDKRHGACPGHIVDHIIPLCAGGPDKPSNMQWQTTAAAKAKDRDERRRCASLRRDVQGLDWPPAKK